jgi:predicted dehydrogenase
MLKVGVIGSGYWGKHHLRIFSNIPCELIGIADIDPSKEVLAKQYGVGFFQDFRKLLKKVDAVSIVTPPSTHFDLAKKALRAGKHVLLEKPFVTDSREANILKNLAKERGLIIMPGHTYLYHPAVQALKNIIEKKELGNIYYLILQWLNLGIIRKDANALYNFGPHPFSILNYLMKSAPISVTSIGNAFVQDGVEDVVFTTLEYQDHSMAHISLSWLHPTKVREVTIVGSKQLARFNDTDINTPLTLYDKGITPEDYAKWMNWETYSQFQSKTRYGTQTIPVVISEEPLKAELSDFLTSIEHNKPPISDIESALTVVALLEKAQKSLKKKGARIEL